MFVGKGHGTAFGRERRREKGERKRGKWRVGGFLRRWGGEEEGALFSGLRALIAAVGETTEKAIDFFSLPPLDVAVHEGFIPDCLFFFF